MVSGSKPQKKVQDMHEAGEKLHEVKARTYGKEKNARNGNLVGKYKGLRFRSSHELFKRQQTFAKERTIALQGEEFTSA